MRSQLGINVGVIAQHYKTITRLFLCKHALVEDLGQNPHRAFKIDPQLDATKFKSVLGPSRPHIELAMAPGRNSEEFKLYISS